jgi:hypothetical protein
MRAQREFFAETYTQERLVHDLGIVDSTNLLLKPLLEGMALFTEFDAGPGSANTFAMPGYWADAIR